MCDALNQANSANVPTALRTPNRCMYFLTMETTNMGVVSDKFYPAEASRLLENTIYIDSPFGSVLYCWIHLFWHAYVSG